MAEQSKTADQSKIAATEPRGFGEHTRGLSGEYAHEQGWGLNEAERTLQSPEPQDTDGGNDYEYGARDFGDEPVNVAIRHAESPQESSTDPDAAPAAGATLKASERR